MTLKICAIILLFGLASNLALGKEPQKTALLLVEDKIAAANSHYKSVLTQLADSETSARITKDKAGLKRFENDVAILRVEKETAQSEISKLVKECNGLLKKARAPRESQKNVELILIECQLAAESSHHKTVLTQIADRRTASTLAGGASETVRGDLAILEGESGETQRVIDGLVKKYNSLAKK